MVFPTVEHAYQAAKTLDMKQRKEIALIPTPAKAKRAGRKVDLRPDWDTVKIDIMRDLVWQKFRFHPDLQDALLDTGNLVLEDGNHWNDGFWGICPPNSGNGENHLGQILMEVRSNLRKE